MAILTVNNLAKSYNDNKVLKDISIQLEKGQVLVVIGSSGSGKTTFLRCLNFLETADSGEIVVKDKVIFSVKKLNALGLNDKKILKQDKKRYQTELKNSLKDIRTKRLNFGLVFQSFNLFPQYTVLQNVKLAMDLKSKETARKEKLSKEEKKKMLSDNDKVAKELIRRVGLEEKTNSYPCYLSGGQQQRVAIARALALNPAILCFDEPTSALDPELTREVLKVIKSLKSKERTMIIVTHEMEFAKNIADYVIYMDGGLVEEQGTPEEIFENPKSEKLKKFILQQKEDIAEKEGKDYDFDNLGEIFEEK